MAINPLEFNERCEFGHYETKPNPKNGNKNNVFIPDFSRWFGYRTQTLNQQFTLLGVNKQHTKMIAIRHDDKVNEQVKVRIKGIVYDVVLISSDDRSARETFDLLTLALPEKP
ncbi:phage head closure protein [Convivina intestini]|uniref:phage head closure protein n=1 Tax=Convivina intestini TaxID=1505726 RepID=UPI00200FC4A5|nr:phage head closure protein [Convivina intestini]CAH1857509.1 hypothetical protein R077811_01543 [Convivina intestini]